MTALDLAVPRLKVNEGFRALPYRDPMGHWTVGYGTNLDAGLSQTAAAALLQAQATDLYATLAQFWWWPELDPVRGSVVLEMAFNLGTTGLLHFVSMIAAIGKQDWATAALELLDSDAARQLPERYGQLANLMRNGQ